MEGELFTISLMENVQPFGVKAPWLIPFAYQEKLRSEMDSLQQQDIIATGSTTLRVVFADSVAPKKETDDIILYVDLSKLNRFSVGRDTSLPCQQKQWLILQQVKHKRLPS